MNRQVRAYHLVTIASSAEKFAREVALGQVVNVRELVGNGELEIVKTSLPALKKMGRGFVRKAKSTATDFIDFSVKEEPLSEVLKKQPGESRFYSLRVNIRVANKRGATPLIICGIDREFCPIEAEDLGKPLMYPKIWDYYKFSHSAPPTYYTGGVITGVLDVKDEWSATRQHIAQNLRDGSIVLQGAKGSGKSTLAHEIEELGLPVLIIDSDDPGNSMYWKRSPGMGGRTMETWFADEFAVMGPGAEFSDLVWKTIYSEQYREVMQAVLDETLEDGVQFSHNLLVMCHTSCEAYIWSEMILKRYNSVVPWGLVDQGLVRGGEVPNGMQYTLGLIYRTKEIQAPKASVVDFTGAIRLLRPPSSV
jgi:hypothetical protein